MCDPSMRIICREMREGGASGEEGSGGLGWEGWDASLVDVDGWGSGGRLWRGGWVWKLIDSIVIIN